MNTKYTIISIIISLLVVVLYVIEYTYSYTYSEANTAYQVYLDGEVLGLIESDDELYDLINDEQQEIKDAYGVDYVYPPEGLNIVKINTYNEDYLDAEEIYDKISDLDNFTVKGYEITIKHTEDDEIEENINIYVIDKNIFESALKDFLLSFVTEEELNNYYDGNTTIDDIGSIINEMYFEETITIKESYISVDKEIYTDEDTLLQYLLFGPNAEIYSYTVKEGDSIESISEDYQINTQEFLAANPKYTDKDALLTVGSTVNVTLIDPVLTFVYQVYEITQNETPYTTKKIVDNTKDSSYSEITKKGVNGITLVHDTYTIVNGNIESEANIIASETIVEMVEEEITVGATYSTVSGSYVARASGWGYPTNYPYIITSSYGWRSGKMHYGIDISGTGFRSPIYTVDDGTVVEVGYRSADGNYIVIDHGDNLYTLYAHMYKTLVTEGQTVSKGDQIGEMGQTGEASGVHLHFSVSIGWPYHGTYSFQNPLNYIRLN